MVYSLKKMELDIYVYVSCSLVNELNQTTRRATVSSETSGLSFYSFYVRYIDSIMSLTNINLADVLNNPPILKAPTFPTPNLDQIRQNFPTLKLPDIWYMLLVYVLALAVMFNLLTNLFCLD